MSLLKLVVPAAAIISGAFAAQCSTSGTLTLTNSADAMGLASCKTYSGSIAIATGATEISVPVSRITENLIANGGNDSQLTSLSAPSLQIVDGDLSILEQPNLNTLSMPQLTEANHFTLTSLGPNLLQLDFGTPGLTQVSSLDVSDTYLQNFNGVNLKTAENIMAANNHLLTDLTMQISNVTGQFIIRGNSGDSSQGLTVNLPNLATAGQVQINDCSSLKLPSLANVSNLVSFQDNSFESLALPNLTLIGPMTGGFVVAGNMALTNMTLPNLSRVAGGVVVANNTDLSGAISLPSLELAGSGQFRGVFDNVMMPQLRRMGGTLTILSTKMIQSTCSHFQGDDAIRGQVNCRGAQPSSSAIASSPSSTSSSNVAFHYSASPETVFSVFGGLAALFGLLM